MREPEAAEPQRRVFQAEGTAWGLLLEPYFNYFLSHLIRFWILERKFKEDNRSEVRNGKESERDRRELNDCCFFSLGFSKFHLPSHCFSQIRPWTIYNKDGWVGKLLIKVQILGPQNTSERSENMAPKTFSKSFLVRSC